MKVYYAGNDRADHLLIVAPAADPRGIKGAPDSDWLKSDGTARNISVSFKRGEAEVPDPLGKYLVATGLAKRTRLWMPRAA